MGKPDLGEIIRKTIGDHTNLRYDICRQIAEDVITSMETLYGSQPHLTKGQIPEMRRGYYTFLEQNLKYHRKQTNISEFGKIVADIIGNVWSGLHHCNSTMLFHKRTDWTDDRFIEIVIGSSLSTWDFNHLTQLVVLCHDNAVRLEINGANIGYLRLYFHRRTREGSISKRHPTIEESIQMIRGLK